MFRLSVLVSLACLAAGCATIDFVGESYEPTAHVDVFFSEADVPRQYRVIGQVLASGDQFVSASSLNARMLARAREKGADAVIILEVSRKPMIAPETVTETTTISEGSGGKTIQKSSTASAPAEHNEIRALFIRYQ